MSPSESTGQAKKGGLAAVVGQILNLAIAALPAKPDRSARKREPVDDPSVSFEVTAVDAETEIFLYDGAFRLVDQGVGKKTFSVTPGIYKLNQVSGNVSEGRLLAVRPGMKGIELGRLRFASAIPLENTLETHEYHVSAAADACERIDRISGAGSGIVLVIRDWTSDDPLKQNSANIPDPSKGLKLSDFRGEIIFDVEVEAKKSLDKEPWATLHVAVAPGAYRLSLDLADGTRVEQTLFACAGWDTCVYVLMTRAGTKNRQPQPDLINSAITMLPLGSHFDANDTTLRSEELLRLALIEGNRILSDELRARIVDPNSSPMLALYGSHLLIREAKNAKRALEDRRGTAVIDNTAAVKAVVENLRKQLGRHPDVEAIAIRAGAGDSNYVFSAPPMLRESWVLLLRASVNDAQIIPAKSFPAQISDRLWGDGPWLLWMDPGQTSDAGAASWHEAARQIFQNIDESKMVPPNVGPTSETFKPTVPGANQSLVPPPEQTFASAILEFAKRVPKKVTATVRGPSHRPFPEYKMDSPSVSPKEAVPMSSLRDIMKQPKDRKEIVGRIGIPASKINEWLDSIDK